MFQIVIKKMLKNKWMVSCLLIGSVLAVAMVSSIPIYSDGALQRMLTKDLDNFFQAKAVNPGGYSVNADFSYKFLGKDSIKEYELYDKELSNKFIKDINLPVKSTVRNITISTLDAQPEIQRDYNPSPGEVKLETMSDLQKHAKIISGRMYSLSAADGVYEAVVSQEAMLELDLRLDEVLTVSPINKSGNDTFRIKVVGVFDIKDTKDPYWYMNINNFDRSFLIDTSQFKDSLLKSYDLTLAGAQWYYLFDYGSIAINSISSIRSAFDDQQRWFDSKGKIATLDLPALEVIKEYSDREKKLKITLLVLQIPILLMLVFYIFMVAQLIVDQEKNEIAVLKSRGAGTGQIFLSYLVESLILSGIAILIGPFIGLFICRMLGASNGFLEFVNRDVLPVKLTIKTYLYSLAPIAVFISAMLIPAFMASRTSIVQHKQKKVGILKKPIWKKFFLDIILLAIACWGLYSYTRQQHNLNITHVNGSDMSMDPLLFVISTLFLLGAGLLLLRVYPLLIRILFRLGRKKWPPVLYASFIQVGRSGGQEQFLMLFLIFTLSVGIFSANAARTINTNIVDKTRYEVGADLTLQQYWENTKLLPPSGPPDATRILREAEAVRYKEPRFSLLSDMKGVELATKVFRRYDISAQVGSDWASNVELMAIIPDEFSKVSYLRPGLMPSPMNAYLNLLSSDQSALLVSRSFEKDYNAKVGDSIVFKWGEQLYVEGVINAFIDYWPTFNPKQTANKYLIVANLPYVQSLTAIEPYEVWIKKKPEKTIGEMSNIINAGIAKQGIKIDSKEDVTQQIIEKKNDPMLQSTNGALTMGFIVTMFISTIGFIIYWTLSIRKRVLQFGIFRAMGLSLRKLICILLCEQILISGTSILAGLIIGGVTSNLFIPLFQVIYSSAQQVPPFVIVAKQIDYIRIYVILIFMMIIGFTVLGRLMSKININKAIKLGED